MVGGLHADRVLPVSRRYAMPAHDWTRVYAGTFHHLHNSWTSRLADSLNSGLLPDEFFALSEQHSGDAVPDVITLSTRSENRLGAPVTGATAIAEAPPQVSMHMTAANDKSYRMLRRTIAVRQPAWAAPATA